MIDQLLLPILGSISTYVLTRRTDFIGYNYIDPSNINPFLDLELCAEGQYYDEIAKICGSKYL